MEKLKKAYEDACNGYIEAFCKKQGIEFDGWVGNEIGGIASFLGQYFFNMSDIVLDVNTKQPKWKMMEWQDDVMEARYEHPDAHIINYKSYIMGLRYNMIIE